MKLFLMFTLIISINGVASDVIRSYSVDINDKNLKVISDNFEIVAKKNNKFEIFVLDSRESEFLKISPNAKLISKNINSVFEEKGSGNGYKNYSDVQKYLNDLVAKYPDFLTLENYGISKGKRNLLALKVNTKNNQDKKKEILITGATHGDELMPVEVLLKLMEESISKYGNDERITKMFDDKIIYFIPVISPDSFDSRSRYVEGVDPNRSYPWPDNLNNKPVGVIDSVINFFHKHDFKATLDLHAYGRLVMYPWGYTEIAPKSSEDVSVMSDIVSNMARENEYQHGQISTTIYVAKGNSADYYYWKNKTKAIAVEIGDDKIPPIAKLNNYVNESREMIFKFIENNY